MNLPSYALHLQFDEELGRWYLPLDEFRRQEFGTFEEGLAALQMLMSNARDRESLTQPMASSPNSMFFR